MAAMELFVECHVVCCPAADRFAKQYFFGLDFMIAPVTKSLNVSSANSGTDGTLDDASAPMSIWLPRCQPADQLRSLSTLPAQISSDSKQTCTWLDWCTLSSVGPGGQAVCDFRVYFLWYL